MIDFNNFYFCFFFLATRMSRSNRTNGDSALTMLKYSSKQLRSVPIDDIRREYDAQIALARQLPTASASASTADTGARFMLSLHVTFNFLISEI
jgi:hypothetical protein